MKLTKAQAEIVEKMKEVENSHTGTVYYRYIELSKKIHGMVVNKDKEGFFKSVGVVGSHKSFMNLADKGYLKNGDIQYTMVSNFN